MRQKPFQNQNVFRNMHVGIKLGKMDALPLHEGRQPDDRRRAQQLSQHRRVDQIKIENRQGNIPSSATITLLTEARSGESAANDRVKALERFQDFSGILGADFKTLAIISARVK